jgi:hypothetical protein
MNFEEMLEGRGRQVRLRRQEAHELAQKLRARGGTEEAARLESKLADGEEVALGREEARRLLEELRASGRRWVGGAARPQPTRPEPPPRKGGLLSRFRRR